MSAAPPIDCVWDGQTFHPTTAVQLRRADQYFVAGRRYLIVEHHERSLTSHAHYFATLTEAWRNLPEAYAEQFPTMDHLRKYLLIKTGWSHVITYTVKSQAEARRLAAVLSTVDEFSVVVVQRTVVLRYVARSQNMREMSSRDFQRSKDDVLDGASSLVQTPLAEIEKQARSNA